MNRKAVAAMVTLGALGLAACGVPGAGSGPRTSPSASPSPGFRARNGAAGELVQLNGRVLILNSTNGDVTVVYDDNTTFSKTSTGSFADIVAGKCIVASGQKDAAGKVTATSVRLSSKVNGACGGGGPGGFGGFGGPGASPRPTPPSPRPSPSPGQPDQAFVAGEVRGVTGTAVSIQPATGDAQVVTVPTTVTVNRSDVAAATDLALHQCIMANGARDAVGKVAARSIAIVPAGPSGCFTGGGGGFGRGRGNGGGGGGGFGPGPGAGGGPPD